MGSNVKNMSWEWDACRESGNTVFACIIIRLIIHFESSVYKITDFKHSLSSCENYFFIHFWAYFSHRLFQCQTDHSSTVIFFQCSNSHKIEVIIPALQRYNENLLYQISNIFVISYQDEKENDNVNKGRSLPRSKFTQTKFSSAAIHVLIVFGWIFV